MVYVPNTILNTEYSPYFNIQHQVQCFTGGYSIKTAKVAYTQQIIFKRNRILRCHEQFAVDIQHPTLQLMNKRRDQIQIKSLYCHNTVNARVQVVKLFCEKKKINHVDRQIWNKTNCLLEYSKDPARCVQKLVWMD